MASRRRASTWYSRHPEEGVADHEVAHRVAVGTVEVDRLPPGGAVAVGEVGSEAAEVVPLRAEVVVDHVEDHRQPLAVAGIDQPLEPLRTAVAVLDGEGIDAVVAPVALPGELGHRHQLQGGHAQFQQVVEAGNDRGEGAGRGEGADVEFVDQVVLERQTGPGAVAPGEGARVDDPRRSVDALRLPAGGWVGALAAVGEAIEIVLPGLRRDAAEEVAVRLGPQRHVRAAAGAGEAHRQTLRCAAPRPGRRPRRRRDRWHRDRAAREVPGLVR